MDVCVFLLLYHGFHASHLFHILALILTSTCTPLIARPICTGSVHEMQRVPPGWPQIGEHIVAVVAPRARPGPDQGTLAILVLCLCRLSFLSTSHSGVNDAQSSGRFGSFFACPC